MLTTATATVSPPPRYRTTPRGPSARRPSTTETPSSLLHSTLARQATLRRLGLPLGFPLPPLTVPRRPSLTSPPMSPPGPDPVQTKSVEYYRAAPSAPGSHSVDLERVHPVVRPTRSPSDPPLVAPLTIQKRVRSPPAAIIVPPLLDPTRPEIVRHHATPTSYFDPEVSPASSFVTANSHVLTPHATPKEMPLSLPPAKRGPAPGPPPQGPLPPLPDQAGAFSEGDPLIMRAASAREKREARRQSKTPDDKDIAALERSMRRLSRISLGAGTSPIEMAERAASPTISLAGSLGGGRAERTEKLLRRISRMSDGVRLPADYGRVGISGYLVPSSAPVSPGLRGIPPPLTEHQGEYESSELAYLNETTRERPSPALSVPMRRHADHAQSAPGLYAAAIPEANNGLGLGLGLGLTSSDSQSSTMASTSMASLPSITSISTLPSDPTLSTLPSDATLNTLPSESTIRPKMAETRPSRLGSLSSASSTAASIMSSNTFESASTTSLLTPISPPTVSSVLPAIPRSPMSPPRQLRLKPSLPKARMPAPTTALPPIPTAAPPPLVARSSSPDVSSILAQYDGATASRGNQSLTVDASYVTPARVRPGARPRVHSDLSNPPPVPPKDEAVGPKGERLDSEPNSNRSSSDSRVAVEDSRSGEDSNVLDVPPTRPSLESQATPRVASRTPMPQTPAAATSAALSARPPSPDISYILRTTPRPTRRSSAHSLASSVATSRRPTGRAAPPSSFRPTPSMASSSAGPSRRGSDMSISSSRQSSSSVTASSAGLDLEGAGPEVFFGDQYDSADSDSDLDLSTPLPHMMLRAGLLSPRSTIITEALEMPPPPREPGQSGLSARGEALRLKGEKVWKAESRRKIRHRDGRNLRDGVGLTTGLGWSDSEDEDAPSPLRRRLSNVLLAKAQSRPPSQLSRQSTTFTLSRESTYSNLDSTSVSSQSLPRTPSTHPLSLPLTPSSLPGGAPGGTDEFGKLDFPMPPTATSWRGLPSPGIRRLPSNSMLRSASATASSNPSSSVPAPVASSSLRSRTLSAASSAATNSTSSHASPRSSLPRQSKMPTPTPRPTKINVRPPTATRLSAPEALREAESLVADGPRRLSGV